MCFGFFSVEQPVLSPVVNRRHNLGIVTECFQSAALKTVKRRSRMFVPVLERLL